MKAIKFKLSGKTACFRKPDVNAYTYFTYHHIHRIALMGILGSVIGLKGYNQQGEAQYPEFYEKLNSLFLSVVPPRKSRGFFTKKIQTFNNSVGYASKETGGNLIVREQWLEDPSWEIYVGKTKDVEDSIWEKLVENLKFSRAEFIPYLGKNDHPATILEAKEVVLNNYDEEYAVVDSLYKVKEMKAIDRGSVPYSILKKLDPEEGYLFQDYMPFKLEETNNIYVFEKYAYTDSVLKKETLDLWVDEDKGQIIANV